MLKVFNLFTLIFLIFIMSGPLFDGTFAERQPLLGNITSADGISYTYGTKPHAVTAFNGNTYAYDANGNMTTWNSSYTLGYDIENRMTSNSNNNSSYVYDGDGNRVKRVVSSVTTVYPNKYYEKNTTSSVITLYYFFGGQMVALKSGSTLEYVSQDHLGSTSVTTDTSGNVTSRTRYKPFGEILLTSNQETSGTLNTERKFTGQIFDTGTDLYFYNARYYDRTLRRFTQADDIDPNRNNSQELNRYSYVMNNPLRYNDPTGQVANDPSDDLDGDGGNNIPPNIFGLDQDWWECIWTCSHTQNIRDMIIGQGGGNVGGASGGSPEGSNPSNFIGRDPFGFGCIFSLGPMFTCVSDGPGGSGGGGLGGKGGTKSPTTSTNNSIIA